MAGDSDGGIRALPFRSISDFEMTTLQNSYRSSILEKFENNGFIKFFKKHRTDVPEFINPSRTKQYYDIDELNDKSQSRNLSLDLCHLNIRRISKNKGKLMALLSVIDKPFDVIALSEIGDNANSFLNENFDSNYKIVQPDLPTNNKYGGTAILVNKNIKDITLRDDLKINKTCNCTKCATESTWIEFSKNNCKFIVCCIYRHVNGNVQHFNTALQASLEKLDRNSVVVIAGDMNINLLNIEHGDTLDYYTTLTANNFLPYILSPTRITDTSATCIDHIFIKLPLKHANSNIISGNILAEITDHLPNFIKIIGSTNTTKSSERPYTRIFSEANIEKFKTNLDTTDWHCLLSNEDVNMASKDFYNHVIKTYNQCFPITRLSRKKNKDKKWMTEGLRKSTKTKNSMYKKQLQKPTPENIRKYKKYRNLLNDLLEKAEILYYKDLISDKSNGIKNFWKSFGSTLNSNKRKNHSNLRKLIIENTEVTEDVDIANAMNNHFCTIGQKINNKIPGTTGHFKDYLNNQIGETFFLNPVSQSEIMAEISKLNENKSAGPDDLKPKLVKACVNQLILPLSILFNKSIEKAMYPSDFKLAKVIALYKKNPLDLRHRTIDQ